MFYRKKFAGTDFTGKQEERHKSIQITEAEKNRERTLQKTISNHKSSRCVNREELHAS